MSERKIVIVTGASRGIGAATARLLGRGRRPRSRSTIAATAARPTRSCATSRRRAAKRWPCRATWQRGRHFAPVRRDRSRVRRAHGLVNNAGVTGGMKRRIDAITYDSMMEAMRLNVVGPLLCAREAVRRMSTRNGGKGGAIVNVSSLGALTGSPGAFIDYAASKGALELADPRARRGSRDQRHPRQCGAARPYRHRYPRRHRHPGSRARFGPTMPIGRAGTAHEVAEAIVGSVRQIRLRDRRLYQRHRRRALNLPCGIEISAHARGSGHPVLGQITGSPLSRDERYRARPLLLNMWQR